MACLSVHSVRFALAAVLAALVTLAPGRVAIAAWPANGMRVCEGGADGGRIWPLTQVTVDPAGIVFMVGRGHSFGSLFRVTPDGDPVLGWWPAPIVPGSPVLDGVGGAHDIFGAPFAEPRSLYLTRYDGTGALASGWTPSGTNIGDDAVGRSALVAAADGAGGAFVAWQDSRSGSATTTDLYLQRVTSSGAVLPSTPGGIRVGTIAQYENVTHDQWTVNADGRGGVFVSWQVAGALHLQRLDGSLAAQWPGEGFTIATGGGPGQYQQVVADGLGGAFLAWTGGAGCQLLHLGADGAPHVGWPAAGVSFSGATGVTSSTSDGAGGVIVAWRTATETRASRFGPGGADASWPVGGVVVHTGTSASVFGNLACTSDGTGGAIVAMCDPGQLLAQRVTAQGTIAPQWPANGAVIRTSGYTPALVRLAPLGPGDAIALWIERWPAGASYHSDDSYAQRIGAVVPLAVEPPPVTRGLALSFAGASPARARLSLTCALSGDEEANVRVLDASGRVRARATLRGDGRQQVTLPAAGELEPGVYLVELRQRGERSTLKAVVVR